MAVTINGTDGIETNTDTGKIKVGASDDLQIYHDSGNSTILNSTGVLTLKNTGSGKLQLMTQGAQDVEIKTNNELAIKCIDDGATELYHNSEKKVETTATGATVTGTLAATAVTGDGSGLTGITSNPPGNRNLWINGDMSIAQRGTAAVTTNNFGTVDRMRLYYDNQGSTAPTQEQISLTSSDTGPWAKGFRKAYRVKTASSGGAANANGQINVQYIVEAQDLATSGWDYTSASSKLTLSFWIRCNVANNVGIYSRLPDTSGNLNYTMETGDLTADTWTYVTKTIPGASHLTINHDNGIGWLMQFIPFYGTDYSDGSAVLDTWKSAGTIKPTTDNWITSNNAYMDITGVQLEVADSATEYEHRSIGEELVRCQRYFFQSDNFSTNCSQGPVWGSAYSATEMFAHVQYPQPMRAAPTWNVSDNSGTESAVHKIGNPDVTGVAVDRYGATSGCRVTKSNGFTSGAAYMFAYRVDAEL